MRIKEIELDNFKSFGRRTVVPLLDGFTTISGPNGSGKSNIIDSLLFALGLSSTRTMRAERLPDLLNNLSGKNEAKVTVKFTNDADAELEVTRRIRVKDNGYTSTYMLNGKNTTLTEVHDELIKYNVSPTGFNVIMQGDVTNIVTMSATERRKIIDELAGVAEFDRRIDQANDELTAVGEKIEHQQIVLTEILARLETLKSDRDQALKYLDLKTQKETIERDLVFIRLKEFEDKVVAAQNSLEKLDKKDEDINVKIETKEIELLQLRAEIGQIEEEIREKGGNEQLLIRQELETTRGELTRQENQLSNLLGVIGEKNKLGKSIESQIKVIDKHLNELTKGKKQAQQDLQAVEEIRTEKLKNFETVEDNIEQHRKEKDKSSQKVTSIHEELQSLREQRHQLEVKKTELSSKKNALEKELETIRHNTTNNIGKASSIKTLLSGLEYKFEDDQARVLGIERNVKQLEAEMDSTSQELEEKRKELETINKKLIQLETARDVQGESGYGRAVEAVLAAKIPGVFGTIGQLGRVDENYTTALEVCIGPRLAHVVVEDDQVAQDCIDYIKRNNCGRATFVPLNKIAVHPPGLLPNRPGVIDFAYNLVDFNPKFAKAFQYACGQTIVVDDMEVGRKLLNQARMVTLEGELFDKSGSMTGGRDNKSKLHFSSDGANDLAFLQARSKTLSEDIQWLNGSLKELAKAINDDRGQLDIAKQHLVKSQAELEARTKELKELEENVEVSKPKLRQSADEIEQIDQEVSGIAKTIGELSTEIQRNQDQLDSVVSGGKVSEIDLLIGQLEELRVDLEAVENEFKDCQRQLDRIETEERVEITNKEGLQEQYNTLNSELFELNEQKPTFESKIQELKNAIIEMEKKVTDLSDELQALRDKKEAKFEAITKTEIEKTKLDQDLVHLAEERQKLKMHLHELKEERDRLKADLDQLLAEQPDYQPPSDGTVEELLKQIEKLERRMRALEPVNMKAIEDYEETEQRKDELDANLHILGSEKEEILQRIMGYDELKRRTFMEAFDAVNANFQEIFAELSHGHGRLELENPENPFAGGLIIRAQPRDKKMQRIEALSGGEKSLTALSFVFAFQRYAPAPFYAFDEVDMMLDGANAERLARMVRRQCQEAQFVVVSLRRPMIENADHAIGVSLRADGYSRVVGIQEIKLPDEEEQEPETDADKDKELASA